ncbi:MAG: methyltransferase [Pseudomonadota bacterium]
MAEQYDVIGLDRQGRGVVTTSDATIYVKGALPGDVVTGMVLDGEIETPHFVSKSGHHTQTVIDGERSPAAPLQHIADPLYSEWKASLVNDALAANGIDVELQPLVPCAPQTRRRAAFSVIQTQVGLNFGFQRPRSHEIIADYDCPVLAPLLVKARPALKALAKAALPIMAEKAKPATMLTTVTKTGLDVAMEGVERLNSERREAALKIALKANLARLSINGELIVETRKPIVLFDDIPVEIPAGAFLQAVPAIEAQMRELVASHLTGTKRVLDLFSGCGTFSLPLAKNHTVHAVEMDQASLDALAAAARKQPTLKQVSTERRDLFERPVTTAEMEGFDALVFDPPRAGAEAQAKEIAQSPIEKVAAVSCNPETLARDLRILMDGGYALKSVTPFDQFLWTHHVEAVALLGKPKRKKSKAARQGW